MKLRTKLVLAVLLLSVVPLLGATVYSYLSSIRALRRAGGARLPFHEAPHQAGAGVPAALGGAAPRRDRVLLPLLHPRPAAGGGRGGRVHGHGDEPADGQRHRGA